MADSILRAEYAKVKDLCADDMKGVRAGESIIELANVSLDFLTKKCTPIELVSKVPGKQYFSFKKGKIVARPANKQFFVPDSREIARLWKKWVDELITPIEFAKLTYTIALAPCLAMEIFDRQNKKGPATFFECYIESMDETSS